MVSHDVIAAAISRMDLRTMDRIFVEDWPGLIGHLDAVQRTLISRSQYGEALLRLGELEEHYRNRLGPMEMYVDFPILSNTLSLGRLVLVCGAGVSRPDGLPDWRGLVLACLQHGMQRARREYLEDIRTVERRLSASETYASADLTAATDVLSRAAGDQFQTWIREVLNEYPATRHDAWQRRTPSALHKAIVDLGQSRLGTDQPGLAAIITYNFDDLLEAAYRYFRIDVAVMVSVHGEFAPALAPASELRRTTENSILGYFSIWHPHGWLPRLPLAPWPADQLNDVAAGTDLVFSESSYVKNYGNSKSLTVRAHDLLLKDAPRVCLFLGTSFTDDYQIQQLRQLLRPRWWHYAFITPPKEVVTPESTFAWFLRQKAALRRIAVRPVLVSAHSRYAAALDALHHDRNGTL
jgi:hypothetical protein